MDQQRPALAIAVVHAQHGQDRSHRGRLPGSFAGFGVVSPAAVMGKSFQSLGTEAHAGWRQVRGGRTETSRDGAAHGINDGRVALAKLQFPEFLLKEGWAVMRVRSA